MHSKLIINNPLLFSMATWDHQKFIDAHKMHLYQPAAIYTLSYIYVAEHQKHTIYMYAYPTKRYSEYYPSIYNTKYHIEI